MVRQQAKQAQLEAPIFICPPPLPPLPPPNSCFPFLRFTEPASFPRALVRDPPGTPSRNITQTQLLLCSLITNSPDLSLPPTPSYQLPGLHEEYVCPCVQPLILMASHVFILSWQDLLSGWHTTFTQEKFTVGLMSERKNSKVSLEIPCLPSNQHWLAG